MEPHAELIERERQGKAVRRGRTLQRAVLGPGEDAVSGYDSE